MKKKNNIGKNDDMGSGTPIGGRVYSPLDIVLFGHPCRAKRKVGPPTLE